MDVPAAGNGEAPGRPPLTWCDVLEQEYRALHGEPPLQDTPSADPRQRLRDVYSRIHLQGPFALCLSGGGIRSATFALGVLQGLAHLGVLGRLHYLSTVSGGGYTGGWLTTWLHRAGREGHQAVLRDLDPAKGSLLTSDADTPDETSPIERVRRTCRYLAPTGGVVSADAWTLVTTMGRNLLLNWLVLLPLLAAALLVPRVYYAVAQAVEQGFTAGPCLAAGTPQSWLLVATLAGFSVCTGYLVLNFVGRSGSWSQGRFLMLFLAPLVGAAVAFTLFWAAYPCQFSLRHALLISAAVPAGGWLLVGGLAPRIWGQPSPDDGSALHVRPGLRTILAALATGPVLGVGAYWFGAYEFGFGAGDPTTSRSSDPPLGVGPIVREMLGLTTDRNPYVYLSDGGHYENLGVWEMVARRCRLIVVSDAGCDPEYSFADLANAIRRIRLDLGIPIQFPPLELTRSGQGRTNPHVAIGTVRYSVIDGPDAPDGTIIYLKATLSGDEPVDVLNFATVDPAFPHDSTGDQFFDEARFESYRTLGFHTVLSAADAVLKGVPAEGRYPAAHSVAASPSTAER